MRLLLDAHISGKRIGKVLEEHGHEVLAVDSHSTFEGWSDDRILNLAAAEGRILVTFNVRDFPELTREWAEAGRNHAGCAVVVGIDHSDFGLAVEILEAALSLRPAQDEWINLTFLLGKDLTGA